MNSSKVDSIEYFSGLIGSGHYQQTIDELTPLISADKNQAYCVLLADAYFHLRQYRPAMQWYEHAIHYSATISLREKLQQCRTNLRSEIESEAAGHKETDIRFSQTELRPDNNDYNIPIQPNKDASLPKKKKRIKPHTLFIQFLLNILLKLTSAIAAFIHSRNTTYFTNWHKTRAWLPEKLNLVLQLIRLAWRRERLFDSNLIEAYPPAVKIGFYKNGDNGPPPWALEGRSDDGSWNWLPKDNNGNNELGNSDEHDPMVGAAMTRFNRNLGDDLGAAAVVKLNSPGTCPVNIFHISNVLLKREEFIPIPFLNLIAMSWIQFMTHDWVSHGDNDQSRTSKIPLPEGDFRRAKYNLNHIAIPATRPDPNRGGDAEPLSVTHLNEVTHWWDASQIYGSNKHTTQLLRSDENGKIIGDGKLFLIDDKLPTDNKLSIEQTGFNRNWWLGLGMLHTIFVHEHNVICDMLKSAYPSMQGDALFLKARLINAALLAKIHTVEWTPAILPNPALYHGMHANWYGLLSGLFSAKGHKKTLSKFDVKNRELGGIVGHPRISNAKFAFSEEFTAVYRMHSLIPDTIDLFTVSNEKNKKSFSINELRHANSPKIIADYHLSDLFYSMGRQHPGALVLNNFPQFMRELSVGGNAVQDLAALDIYRDRERGVPFYNQLRRELSLKPFESFDQIHPDTNVVNKLRDVYGQNRHGQDKVENIDLMIGTLAEGNRPAGFGFGETLFEVFILNASWRLLTDRFYTDDYRPEIYSHAGLDWIDNNDMKSVLLRHCPQLIHTGLNNVDNAFEPWDTNELSEARHPLESIR